MPTRYSTDALLYKRGSGCYPGSLSFVYNLAYAGYNRMVDHL